MLSWVSWRQDRIIISLDIKLMMISYNLVAHHQLFRELFNPVIPCHHNYSPILSLIPGTDAAVLLEETM